MDQDINCPLLQVTNETLCREIVRKSSLYFHPESVQNRIENPDTYFDKMTTFVHNKVSESKFKYLINFLTLLFIGGKT